MSSLACDSLVLLYLTNVTNILTNQIMCTFKRIIFISKFMREQLSVLLKAYNDKIPIFHLIGC